MWICLSLTKGDDDMADKAKADCDPEGSPSRTASLRPAAVSGRADTADTRAAVEPMSEMAAKLDIVRDFIARSGAATGVTDMPRSKRTAGPIRGTGAGRVC